MYVANFNVYTLWQACTCPRLQVETIFRTITHGLPGMASRSGSVVKSLLLEFLGQFQTPLHSSAKPNWWVKYGRRATFESVWIRQVRFGAANNIKFGRVCRIMRHWSGSWFILRSPHVSNLMHTAVNYCKVFFIEQDSWLAQIEWWDQSCMKLKVVAKNKDNKIPVCLRFMRNRTI